MTEHEYLMDLNTFLLVEEIKELDGEEYYLGKAKAMRFEEIKKIFSVNNEDFGCQIENKSDSLEHFSIDKLLGLLSKEQERI
jgi:hypothetical protein